MKSLPTRLHARIVALWLYHSFYRTKRGIAIPAGRTLELTQNRTLVGEMKFLNFYPFNDIETISPRPLLFIAGDQAHSKEFSEDAYQRAVEPKELYWVKDANHVDLYDRVTVILWSKAHRVLHPALVGINDLGLRMGAFAAGAAVTRMLMCSAMDHRICVGPACALWSWRKSKAR
jgi:hypothetical protein